MTGRRAFEKSKKACLDSAGKDPDRIENVRKNFNDGIRAHLVARLPEHSQEMYDGIVNNPDLTLTKRRSRSSSCFVIWRRIRVFFQVSLHASRPPAIATSGHRAACTT